MFPFWRAKVKILLNYPNFIFDNIYHFSLYLIFSWKNYFLVDNQVLINENPVFSKTLNGGFYIELNLFRKFVSMVSV
jgi:hypothetical protein